MRACLSAHAFRARLRHALYNPESEHLKFYALGTSLVSLSSWPCQHEFEYLYDSLQRLPPLLHWEVQSRAQSAVFIHDPAAPSTVVLEALWSLAEGMKGWYISYICK